MIKSFFERVKKAVKVLFEKEEEVITEVKKDTELYNLVQSDMMAIQMAPIKEKIESIEKILYFTTKTLTVLTGQTEENKRLLTEQAALVEEMVFVFEQLMKSVTVSHSGIDDILDASEKLPKKRTIN